MLRRNMNKVDRTIRLMITISLYLSIYSFYPLFGSFVVSLIILIFATINLYATLSGVCLGYAAFKLSTIKR